MSKANSVKLQVLDTEVQLACKPGEEGALADAAAFVDKSMRDMRMKTSSSSTEKLAIVTAITTAYSLLLAENNGPQGDSELVERVENINKKLDSLLDTQA